MLKSITVTNHLDESLELNLQRPEKSGIYIINAEGLGPAKANVNMIDISTGDGSLYNSARLDPRNIVLTLGFLAKPTIEDTRLRVYKYFPIKKQVRIQVKTTNRVSEIIGYGESNEPEIFSKDQTTQISILCPDPYFYSVGKNTTIFSGNIPVFEFPFSNESLSDNLLEMSTLRFEQDNIINYTGDADVGIQIHMHAIGAVHGITIYNNGTREKMIIDDDRLVALVGSNIKYGDDIIITTTKSYKSAVLIRDGVSYNILNSLDRDSDWFTLTRGQNIFVYSADSGVTNLEFKITNKIAYEGV